MAARQNTRVDRLALTFRQAMTPIFVFALVSAVVCWAAAWVFKETYVFSATLLGLGCLPIVVAICAYLLVLVHKVERES
jgi:tellurite resistance protein TehA-like permease